MILKEIKHSIVRFVGHIWIPHDFDVPRGYATEVAKTVQPGDVILTRIHLRFSNLFIKGKWTHVALADGRGGVIEAVEPCVRFIRIEDVLCGHDEFAIYRPRMLNDAQREQIPFFAAQFVGLPYDDDFDMDPSDLYCTELALDCFERVLQMIPPWTKRFFGVALPDSFTDSDYFVKIAQF